MRDDLVTVSMARRLRQAGLSWRPQVGDWCALLDAAHISGEEAGIWLIIDVDTAGTLTVVDGAAKWSARRIVASEALWLPASGQLKMWLRAFGYQVSTYEGTDAPAAQPIPQTGSHPAWAASLLGEAGRAPSQPVAPLRHVCRVSRLDAGGLVEGRGMSEAEAVAEALAHVLTSDERLATRRGW